MRIQLKEDLGSALSKKQILVAIDQADKATKRAHSVLLQTDTKQANSVINKMEKKVARREAQALKGAADILVQFSDAEIEKLDEPTLARVSEDLQDAAVQFERNVIEHAALDAQLELERQRNLKQFETWAERAADAEKQNHTDLANLARRRGVPYSESAMQLAHQLQSNKHLALTMQQTLADIRSISEKIKVRQQKLNEASPHSDGDRETDSQ
jgi:phage shock protein A